ncbi:MAG TPA: nuclear transport factor 2 family protein [Kofleriaceae bacterium]
MSYRLVALAALTACAAPRPAPVSGAVAGPDVIAAVKAAAAEFDAAQLHGDRATLARYLAADFVFIRGGGAVAGRDAFIAGFTDAKQKLEPFTVEHGVALPLAPSCVLIGGEATLRGTDDGTPFAEHIRYADIFQLRDGRWQVIYTQVTLVK